MDRIVAFNVMYAFTDFNAISLSGWIFVVFVGHPTILKICHGVFFIVSCLLFCGHFDIKNASSTLPIAIALASKWAYPNVKHNKNVLKE